MLDAIFIQNKPLYNMSYDMLERFARALWRSVVMEEIRNPDFSISVKTFLNPYNSILFEFLALVTWVIDMVTIFLDNWSKNV